MENLREYAADLKRLILNAYPRRISAGVREDMIMKQFFDGLQDEEARYMSSHCSIPETWIALLNKWNNIMPIAEKGECPPELNH